MSPTGYRETIILPYLQIYFCINIFLFIETEYYAMNI
jgi:hypothetical protein